MNTTIILALVMLTPQNAAVTLNDIAGKSFDELVPLLGKPISARDQRGIGEWRTFKSPFKTSTSIVAFRKSEELIPGQIQVVFPKSVTDWKVALKAVAIDPKGGKLSGMQITGLSTKWNPFWNSQERVLSINVSAAIIASATKRIVQQRQNNLLSLGLQPEDRWIKAYGEPIYRDGPVELEFEHTATKATKKAREWQVSFQVSGVRVDLGFRGASSAVGIPYVISVHAKPGQTLEQLMQSVPVPRDRFGEFSKADANRIPPTMSEFWEGKSKDGKWLATFPVHKDSSKLSILTIYNLDEDQWRQKVSE